MLVMASCRGTGMTQVEPRGRGTGMTQVEPRGCSADREALATLDQHIYLLEQWKKVLFREQLRHPAHKQPEQGLVCCAVAGCWFTICRLRLLHRQCNAGGTAQS